MEIQLYQKMKAGDRSAFDEIFRLYYKSLVELAYKKVYNIAVAEDIVQNIFINFWVKREERNIETNLEGYLKKTVHNRCIDFFRKEKKTKVDESEYIHSRPLLNISSPETDLLSQENLDLIYQKIESLPPKCAAVFKLSRFEKMSYADIATHLNISVKTVEFHISTALRILRKAIFFIIFFMLY